MTVFERCGDRVIVLLSSGNLAGIQAAVSVCTQPLARGVRRLRRTLSQRALQVGRAVFPNLVPDRPDAGGAALSRKARLWWHDEWQDETFMAVGMRDPVLGPLVIAVLRRIIRNCPPPYEHSQAGHLMQEWGKDIARRALAAFHLE